MSKQSFLVVGGVALLAILGFVGWYLFSDSQQTADQNALIVNTVTDQTVKGTLAYQQGTVEVNTGSAGWKPAVTDMILREKDSVRTGADSKAILELENGDIIRLGYSTEITLHTASLAAIQINQIKGATYNRVQEGVARVFSVVTSETTIEALGTAFDVLISDEIIDVNVVLSKVKVKTGAEQKEVEEGKTASVKKDDASVAVKDFDETKLDNEWYAWNKEQDQGENKSLGILAKAESDDQNAEQNENENAGETENKEQEQEQNEEQKEEVKEEPKPTPEPEEETPVYTGPSLSITAAEDGVNMWWSDKSGNPGFKYYKVVRSETDSDLKYPEDGYIAVRSKGEEHYSDKSAIKNKKYYYRICAVGDEVLCGSVRQVTAINTNDKPSAVTLSGEVVGDDIKLTWTKSSITDFKYYKLVWSKTDSTPTYPENGYLKPLEQSTLTYTHESTDELDLTEGTHYYSICVVDTADQIACSNTVTVTNGSI